MSRKEQIRKWGKEVLGPWLKTPRGAFIAGLVLGTVIGKQVLALLF
jgi:hypothetical protein